MAVVEKFYPLTRVLLMNAVCDVAEIRKAKVTYPAADEIKMETEMYKRKKVYLFRWTGGNDGTTLLIETDGNADSDREGITLMFSILDGIIHQAIGCTASDG